MEPLFYIIIGISFAVLVALLLRQYAGFYGQRAEDYDDGFPSFEIKDHLNGQMVCDGVIFGPMGRVTSTFTADFDIHWDGDTAVMDEKFRYNDGSVQDRQWTIKLGSSGQFVATAEDVPGRGKGTVAGPSVGMKYAIKLPESAGGHILNTVDWMYLTPDGVIVNRSQFRKFGIKVAELVATIRPKAAE